MRRIRLSLPTGRYQGYRNQDLVHDALVNAWTAAGAPAERVLGPGAGIWHFGTLGWRNGQENRVHTLIVGTADPELSRHLDRLSPDHVRTARAMTGEMADFSGARIMEDPDPVAPGQRLLGVVMLSPLAISRRDSGGHGPRWHGDIRQAEAGAAISARLSRLMNRPVALEAEPDHLYLRAHERHDVLVQTKSMKNGRRAFVIGMRVPLVIRGNEEDLRLAWYAGIGEKNRDGFGCVGLAERGIGR